MWADLKQFGKAVGAYSGAVIGGAIVAALSFAYAVIQAAYYDAASPWTAFLCSIAVLVLFLACFMAWRDERDKRLACERRSGSPTVNLNIDGLAKTKDVEAHEARLTLIEDQLKKLKTQGVEEIEVEYVVGAENTNKAIQAASATTGLHVTSSVVINPTFHGITVTSIRAVQTTSTKVGSTIDPNTQWKAGNNPRSVRYTVGRNAWDSFLRVAHADIKPENIIRSSYSSKDWLALADEIKQINEEMAWVMWTKRPPEGPREWDTIGEEDAKTFRFLAERAGRMLLKSGIDAELPEYVRNIEDPVNRWFEYVSGGGELRIDGRGYERDESSVTIHYISGRLLNAVEKSLDMCRSIGAKLT